MKVIVHYGDEPQMRDLAVEQGLEIEGPAADEFAMDPGTILVVVGLLALGKFVLTAIERFKGGVRIDLGTRPPTIDRRKELPYGMVVVFTADDDVRIQMFDEAKDAVERLISDLFRISGEVTAAAVSEVVGRYPAAAKVVAPADEGEV